MGAGSHPGARHVAKSRLEQEIEGAVPDRSTPLVLYCAAGVRSLFVGQALRAMGYEDVVSMSGGFEQWTSLGLPWSQPAGLSEEQRRRYSRHLLIPEVGVEGQAKLLASKALLVGAGGLGSPAALYLAAAGVGTLGIVDFDVVDLSNLQRQVLHTTARIGEKKVVSAAAAIHALNPGVNVIAHDAVLGPTNVDELIAGYDVILDGTDTFETRYTLNDAAVAARIPVDPRFRLPVRGPALDVRPLRRAVLPLPLPDPAAAELAPGCSVAGVLGVVPGIMGLLQANKALKVLLGIGDTLAGRLLLFDALDTIVHRAQAAARPGLPGLLEAAVEARAAGAPPIRRRPPARRPARPPAPRRRSASHSRRLRRRPGVIPVGRARDRAWRRQVTRSRRPMRFRYPATPITPAYPRITRFHAAKPESPVWPIDRRQPAPPPGPARRAPRAIRDALVAHARAEHPNKACGLIAGTAPAADGGTATRWFATRNQAASPLRYEVHPDDLLRASLAIDDADEVIWGIVHSHVRSAARPPRRRARVYPDALYLSSRWPRPRPTP